MTKAKLSKGLIYTLLLIGGIAMSIPFIWLLFSSFKHNKEIIGYPPTFFPETFTLTHYLNLNSRFNIGRYFLNSVFLSTVKTVLAVYTSLLCGYVLAKFNFFLKNFLFKIVLFTMMVPYIITVIPVYQMITDFGWKDQYIAIIAPTILSSFGIFMMRQYIKSGVPDELLEAARIDGAGEFRIFHTIVIPLCVNMISALTIFLFLWNWEDFLWPYLVLNTQDKFPLAVALNMFSGQNTTNYGGLFATSLVTILPVVIVYFMFQKRFVEGISMSGIK
ncbi:carbohydrate ABC transporter permease [Halanaerobium sp. ST460_2HS_T2]|uniref:carbohydrate ABC transporter permease n=1 Tax=Halanaerobium sp. ST460_2HS_T2 TaxID=2183914 RepID=UPI000DF26C24|nr:carbohydrate ABC transporter permease [Halanaerobium sp. ST460_2HS_T2]RCW55358.1 multiple sugar transport system permease protein/raffinose/stachyose/melibiose transport system permease protein [Halanaerobium sp. ST460_2HS_T2]